MINRNPVQSSNVVSVGYDVDSQTLEIEFKDGAVYQYYNVPQTIHDELMNSSSVGKFIHQYIKNGYPFARV
jgi:hypothetical protein